MKPLGKHIIVQEEVAEQIGGIFLTKKAKMDLMLGRPRVFRVISVGPGRLTKKGVLIPPECRAGDRIICHSYFEGPIDLPDGRHIITQDQILAVLPTTNNHENTP